MLCKCGCRAVTYGCLRYIKSSHKQCSPHTSFTFTNYNVISVCINYSGRGVVANWYWVIIVLIVYCCINIMIHNVVHQGTHCCCCYHHDYYYYYYFIVLIVLVDLHLLWTYLYTIMCVFFSIFFFFLVFSCISLSSLVNSYEQIVKVVLLQMLYNSQVVS